MGICILSKPLSSHPFPPFLMSTGPPLSNSLRLNVHRMDEGTEDQRGKVTGLQPHSFLEQSEDQKPAWESQPYAALLAWVPPCRFCGPFKARAEEMGNPGSWDLSSSGRIQPQGLHHQHSLRATCTLTPAPCWSHDPLPSSLDNGTLTHHSPSCSTFSC